MARAEAASGPAAGTSGASPLLSACAAACHRARNTAVSPRSAFTMSSRKLQRGTRELRKTLCTVDELIRPRPTRVAISRIEGRPAARCS